MTAGLAVIARPCPRCVGSEVVDSAEREQASAVLASWVGTVEAVGHAVAAGPHGVAHVGVVVGQNVAVQPVDRGADGAVADRRRRRAVRPTARRHGAGVLGCHAVVYPRRGARRARGTAGGAEHLEEPHVGPDVGVAIDASGAPHEGVVVGNVGGRGVSPRRCAEQQPEVVARAQPRRHEAPVGGHLDDVAHLVVHEDDGDGVVGDFADSRKRSWVHFVDVDDNPGLCAFVIVDRLEPKRRRHGAC